MKVVVLGIMVPFVYGGAEFLVDGLGMKLREHGHTVEVVNIPIEWNPFDKIFEGALAYKMLKLEGADKVIATKFPAYCVNHPNLSIWLIHQFRQAYDMWDTPFGFSIAPNSKELKASVMELDKNAFEGKTIHTISPVVCRRLKEYNGFDSSVLFHPLNDEKIFNCKEYGDFIFYPSRVGKMKRQSLAVEAMKYTRSNVKLIVAGKGDRPIDEAIIFEAIEKHGVADKVTYINRFITEEEKVDLYARSLGTVFIPYDEDSYGFVTLESFHSRKPVISCLDSGGTDVVVLDNETGYMPPSTPEALADAMDKLYNDKKKAKQMGEAGLAHLGKLGISWDTVIERLMT